MRIVFDIESNGLLDETAIDYSCSPYKLRESFKLHCIAAIDIDTKKEYTWVQEDCINFIPWLEENGVDVLIAHNGINFDLLVLKLMYGMDYEIGVQGEHGIYDTINGRKVCIHDTMVLSKTLNPERTEHSMDYFGRFLGSEKIKWRAKAIELGLIEANAPRGAEFAVYHPEMLVYNIQDCVVNYKTFYYLMEEWGEWDWQDAYDVEKYVAWVVTRQEHRGFAFNSEEGKQRVNELDTMMAEIKAKVDPLIPPKKVTKGVADDYTPPKIQFKKNGEPSANLLKFAEKHGGEVVKEPSGYVLNALGKRYKLPLPLEPLVTTMPATIDDTTHLKGWLVSLGWEPSEWKERDITSDSKKKKLTPEKYAETVARYVAQTLDSPFRDHRCEYLDIHHDHLEWKLSKHELKKPLKVYTNPSITRGQDKEICPNLEMLAEKFPFAIDVRNYLTYKHRRNSILGGGLDPDDEDDLPEKGYLASVRQDGRIPTPADTCGAATSRFKHRKVANIPRVTSLYGKEMRALFGVEKGYFQIGYDFDSLEAREEAHYCWRYDQTKEYCNSLTQEKPNDVHTLLAGKISQMIEREFKRAIAKAVKYGCTYGASAPKVAKTVGCDLSTGTLIYNAFWEAALPLKQLKEKLADYWKTTGKKKFILGIDGRKVPTRSAHAILNSLFQSAGVICAKRAMVIHDRKLREAGLSVDFFKDDWKNKKFCQQLIAYHDEAQLEVSASLVTWKLFRVATDATEEEIAAVEEQAKAFKKENPDWSDIGHSDKGFYLGYCQAGVLAVEAVKEAGEYYKLNVPLTAGYMLGTNWSTCH